MASQSLLYASNLTFPALHTEPLNESARQKVHLEF